MRAVHVTKFAADGNLAFVADASEPQLKPDSNDLLVKVLACALNPGDCRLMSGSVSLVMKPKAFPYIPGIDVCGVIVAMGTKCSATSTLKVGDRIVASLEPLVHGSFADLVVFDASLAAMAPPSSVCSALEAASLPVAGCTALQAIKDARIGPGSRVLVIGGSGGVGTLVIQLAKLKGAAFVATTSTNAALVKSLGADLVIDYRHANWWDVLQQQQEALLDVVIDCVGDAASWQHCDVRVLQKNGRYIAVVDSPNTEVRTIGNLLSFLGPILWRSFNPFTTSYKMVSSFPKGKDVRELVDLMTATPGKLHAVLDPASPFEFSLEGVARAVALQNSHRAKGKLVFEVNKAEREAPLTEMLPMIKPQLLRAVRTRVASAANNANVAPAAASTVAATRRAFATDKRYQPVNPVPESVLANVNSLEIFSPGFSVRESEATGKDGKATGKPAYLDFQATTPMDPRVLDAMMPHMTYGFGNPHSTTHEYGWDADAAVEKARESVADLIGANSKEIIFTSGATESNNAILKGIAHFTKAKKKHIVTTQIEHKCVLDSCRVLESEGFDVTYLPVGQNGLIDLEQLKAAIRPDTALVSVIAVHNEIGVVQPLKEIGAICRERKVFFHTDAAQMLGKLPIDVNELNIDVMSLSGHKIYGPKGIGAMYVRRRPRVRLDPIISGGGQERGLRSGTLAHPLCVGFGKACDVAKLEMENDHKWVSYLSKKLYDGITSQIDHVVLNGDLAQRYPGNLNLSFAYVEGESLLMALKNIAVSSGSACTSASLEPSYVLRAIGVGEDLAHTSIRFGLGRFTTEEEVDFAIDMCIKHVTRLREMSPLWEMVQEGIDPNTIQWSQDVHHH